jgi:hypothetical protein
VRVEAGADSPTNALVYPAGLQGVWGSGGGAGKFGLKYGKFVLLKVWDHQAIEARFVEER